ncbi:J domain-containing protein [Methanococcoides sp. SA1]|nr:J domain-containing protein [Methanococcoides sp. SA1]
MNNFKDINDLSELRKLYYQLALKHHPDRGGDVEKMQAINAEYEKYSQMLIDGNTDFSSLRKVYERDVSEELQTKINEIIHFDQIQIEVIGGWLWITGNTFPLKDQLKALSFRYSRNKAAWYWHSKNYIKMSNKQFSMEGIRKLWGSMEIEQESPSKLVLN